MKKTSGQLDIKLSTEARELNLASRDCATHVRERIRPRWGLPRAQQLIGSGQWTRLGSDPLGQLILRQFACRQRLYGHDGIWL